MSGLTAGERILHVLDTHVLHPSMNICLGCDWRPVADAGELGVQHRAHAAEQIAAALGATTVTTREELDALPQETVIGHERHGTYRIYRHWGDDWIGDHGAFFDPDWLPADVIGIPKEAGKPQEAARATKSPADGLGGSREGDSLSGGRSGAQGGGER